MISNEHLKDKRVALLTFAIFNLILAFSTLFLSVGVGCFLMVLFGVIDTFLLTFAYDLIKND